MESRSKTYAKLRNWAAAQASASKRRTEVRPILSCLAMADLLSPLRARSRISCVFPAILAGLPCGRPSLRACANPVAQNVALELGEHRQHAGERPPARRRQIERLAQRDKPHLQRCQFLQGGDEIDERPSPAIEPPHDDDIDFPPASGAYQFLTARTRLCAGADFLDRRRDLPALAFGVGAHRFELHRQRLLIVGRHPGVDGDPVGFDPGQKPLQIRPAEAPCLPGFSRVLAVWPRIRKAKKPCPLAISSRRNRARRCSIRRRTRRRLCGITRSRPRTWR